MKNRLNYKIVNKDGNVVEDLTFDDYDKLADHMLEMADKYYNGILTADDSVEISAFDESGNLVYEDKATFEGSDLGETTADDFRDIIDKNTDTAGQGFGKKNQ